MPTSLRDRTDEALSAFALLTRLPLPDHTGRGIASAWAFPLVGLVCATLAGLGGWLCLALGLPAPLAALVIVVLQVMMTGALHEDGLADTADGLWGGWTRERRLEIMRDSRVGSYGMIAMIVALTARTAALTLLLGQGVGSTFAALIAAAALSRATMPALMALLPPARQDGLSRSTGRPLPRLATLSALIALGIAALAIGTALPAAALVTFLAALAIAHIAQRRIGGQTGDILGATQQVTEIAVLFTLA